MSEANENIENTVTRADVVKEMRSERFVMLTSQSDSGKLHSHPMTPLEVTDDADTYFFVNVTSDHAGNLRHNPNVNLAFADSSTWLSVSGTVTFLEGAEKTRKVDELWSDSAEAWYEQGKADPALGVIRVSPESAQMWNQKGGVIGTLWAFAKMKTTGDTPDGGTDTVTL